MAWTRAEGEGVEPSRLIARPSSNRVPSPIGLPFRWNSVRVPRQPLPAVFAVSAPTTFREAPAGGIEPPIVALTGAALPFGYTGLVRPGGMAGFEPAISCSRSPKVPASMSDINIELSKSRYVGLRRHRLPGIARISRTCREIRSLSNDKARCFRHRASRHREGFRTGQVSTALRIE